MKLLPLYLLLFLGCVSISAAQSGRRVKSAPATPLPAVQQSSNEQTDTAANAGNDDGGTGYSESTPNAPRSIVTNAKKDKKSKKDSAQPTAPSNSTAQAAGGSVADDADVVKVETNLVTIPVSVYDRDGLYITNLQQKDFKIFENGAEQDIAYFGTSETPFSVVLLIDVSPSTAYKIEEIQAAAAAFVAQLDPQDSVMVVEFAESVHTLSEMTTDREKINKGIRRAGFGETTSLYDAVSFSLRKGFNKIPGRKAMVLFTDGVDTSSSRANFENTVKAAEESESVIFPIYYNTYLNNRGIGQGTVMSTPPTLGYPGGGQGSGSSTEDYALGRAYLKELADATGGKVFRSDSTPGGLTAAFESIAEELSRQYSVGYYPKETGAAGDRKQIRVRVDRPKLVIRSRDSYIVGSQTAGG